MIFKRRYERTRDRLLRDRSINAYNRKLFRDFFAWEEEKLKRQNGLSALDEPCYKTLFGYINRLRNVNQWFGNKAWNKLTEREIRQVYNDLEDGKIKNKAGKRFQDRRGYYNKVFKAKPFKLAGLHESVDRALEFFTDNTKKDVRFIDEDGFRRMNGFLHKPQHYALFWLAWDIGENITSLLRLKVKHLRRQTNKDTGQAEYSVYLAPDSLKRSRKSRTEITLHTETVDYLDALLKYGKEIEYRDEKGRIGRKAVPFVEEDLLFSFRYRQALQILDSVVKRSGVKCRPNGEKPSWKDLRSGMACYLFGHGWHVEDINLRLGHSPQSKWLNAYINYLAVNRKKAAKVHFDSSLAELKTELEESRKREKLVCQRLENLRNELSSVAKERESLEAGKGFMSLLMGLAERQRKMSDVLEQVSGKRFDIVLPKPDEVGDLVKVE